MYVVVVDNRRKDQDQRKKRRRKLEATEEEDQDEQTDNDEPQQKLVVSRTHKFITLVGMLAILHKRIKTKYPSRFLAQTLHTVFSTYKPASHEMTAAIVNLVHSLSGRRRPPLPTRQSSVNVANPDQDGDSSKNAPDPEADDKEGKEDPTEAELQRKLLLSFVICVLEAYVNGNDMAWAARLLEFYNPTRVVPGRRTLMAAFRENRELQARDSMVGKLVVSNSSNSHGHCSIVDQYIVPHSRFTAREVLQGLHSPSVRRPSTYAALDRTQRPHNTRPYLPVNRWMHLSDRILGVCSDCFQRHHPPLPRDVHLPRAPHPP